jgi:hypothetical protein
VGMLRLVFAVASVAAGLFAGWNRPQGPEDFGQVFEGAYCFVFALLGLVLGLIAKAVDRGRAGIALVWFAVGLNAILMAYASMIVVIALTRR